VNRGWSFSNPDAIEQVSTCSHLLLSHPSFSSM
jgi:hypothetical protein